MCGNLYLSCLSRSGGIGRMNFRGEYSSDLWNASKVEVLWIKCRKFKRY